MGVLRVIAKKYPENFKPPMGIETADLDRMLVRASSDEPNKDTSSNLHRLSHRYSTMQTTESALGPR